jgi:hypothetical protein
MRNMLALPDDRPEIPQPVGRNPSACRSKSLRDPSANRPIEPAEWPIRQQLQSDVDNVSDAARAKIGEKSLRTAIFAHLVVPFAAPQH